MATRRIIVGGIAGEIVTCACAHVVGESRISNIEDVVSYQHKQKDADTVPFLDVYSSDREVADQSAVCLNNNYAIYPEYSLRNLSFEQAIITEESKTPSRHYAKGLAIFRGDRNCALRLWVEITRKFAENGNHYQTERCCWRVSDEERKLYLDAYDNPIETQLETVTR